MIVGSIGYDDISTPEAEGSDLLGGAATYAGLSAAFHSLDDNQKSPKIGIVSAVGQDFSTSDQLKLESSGLNLAGVVMRNGDTFRWSGKYQGSMENAQTISTDVNVLENFNPEVPESWRTPQVLFCANTHPATQVSVLDQCPSAVITALDSFMLWIKEEEKTLKAIAQYWHASKELTKAKPYYKKAAKVAKEGELYIYLGQVHFGLDEFSEAREAIKLGIKKGKLKDEVSAHMLLGQILFENQEWDNAIVSFRKCIDVAEKQFGVKKKTKKAKEKQKEKKKKAQDQARKWITYTEGEEERVEALKLKMKALGI